MKSFLVLTTCLFLVGCGKPVDANREVLNKLESLKAEVASRHVEPVRWATANKREIESAISEWSRMKAEEAKNAEVLTPEQQEQVRNYETLSSELMQKRIVQHRFPGMTPPGSTSNFEADKAYEALSQKVAAAKAPVAEIIDRRSRQYTQLNDQFKPAKLVAEYAKGRFDLVVDSSDAGFSRSPVLYSNSGEALDITAGVVKLFREKTVK